MTAALAVVLVLLVAAYIVSPLLQPAGDQLSTAGPGGKELWNREKAVAVLAISEADFDRATGKLSDEDYQTLRSDYEGRALQAMDEIEKLQTEAPEASAAARFCGGCGYKLSETGRFCGGCGQPRDAF